MNPLIRAAATCVEPFYAAAVGVRNAMFDAGVRRVHRAHVPVISVGNLTAGGTGKTPMTIYVARHLLDHGHSPAVVLRGYRAGKDGSDEQRELAEALAGVPVIAQADRVAAAEQIKHEHGEVDVIVLDDAFQHRRIARDLDLVLIDATDPLGGGHVLPRGMMRERPGGLRRADAVIVTRCDRINPATRAEVDRLIQQHHGSPPLAHAEHRWTGVVDHTGTPVERGHAHVFAFAAIGNPRAFFDQAADRYRVVGSRARPDHADYTGDDLAVLAHEAKAAGADAMLTTAKDWVKLRRLVESAPPPMPIWRPALEIGFVDGEGELTKLLVERTRKIADCRLPIAD